MRNEFTAVIEPPTDGDPWFIAYCPEIPGANGQGRTKEEVLENLREGIALALEMRREDGLRGVPPEAELTTVVDDGGDAVEELTASYTKNINHFNWLIKARSQSQEVSRDLYQFLGENAKRLKRSMVTRGGHWPGLLEELSRSGGPRP